jgi:hypothetical protein
MKKRFLKLPLRSLIFTGKISTLCLAAMLLANRAMAQAKPVTDSAEKPTLIISPRFNSAGHFPFTGSLLNTNLNFDVNIFYEHKNNGFFLFKSFDLVDSRSGVNYFQPGIFHKFNLTQKLYMRAFFGYLFSQTTGFRDKDSDYYTAATFYYTIHDNLKVENTALFFDLTQTQKLANRLLISYLSKGFKFDLYLWHRWEIPNSFHATSACLAMSPPKVKLSENVSVLATVSYQGYLSAAKPDYALQNGWLVSVAFPISPVKN